MRIVVLGAAGVIGAAVARCAVDRGVEVYAVVRPETSLARLSPCGESLNLRRLAFGDMAALAGLLRQVNPDAIVNAVRVRGSLDAPPRIEAATQSLSTTLSLLNALRDLAYPGALVAFGSAMAYGVSNAPLTPAAALRPKTFTGALKAFDSILLGQFARETGTPTSELRVFSAYGPWDNPERLIPRLLAAGLGGEKVPLTPEPTRRDWIHLDDVTGACLTACAPRHAGFAARNICTGRTRTNHDALRLVEAISGRDLRAPAAYDAPDRYGMDDPVGIPSGPADGFDWSPRLDLEQGLEATWNWARTCEGRAYLGIG